MPEMKCQSNGLQRDKERKTRMRSLWVENRRTITDSFCRMRQLFLFNKRLPPDCCNRGNISKPFNLRKELENRWWCQPSGSCAAFLSTSCLPSPVSVSASRRVGKHLLLCSPGEAGHSSECQQQAYCHQTPVPDLIRTDPCHSHFWAKPGWGVGVAQRIQREKIATERVVMKWLKNDRSK